ncbi:MAG TPA: NifU family protein [Acidimicrobiales bacterium]|nr:NifU family protein [Acidimicrobiales bacterium]
MSIDVEHMPYGEVMIRVGELYEELMAHPDPAVGKKVEDMLDWVDAFHREGLGRLVEMIRSWRGEIFLESVGRDEITGIFLATYDLGELPASDTSAADAVAEALEEVRPFVESHGGTIAVDSIVDGVVKVRMLGSCDGCPSSTATLTGGVEAALREHWPNFRRLEVVDPDEEAPGDGDSGGHAHAREEAAQPVELLQIGRKGK